MELVLHTCIHVLPQGNHMGRGGDTFLYAGHSVDVAEFHDSVINCLVFQKIQVSTP